MDQSNTLTVQFWGVRGSYPVSSAETLLFGGNTPCVEVQAGGRTIIFDGGTGIIALGQKLVRLAEQKRASIDAMLFLSHLHHDHIQGFPFFAPAYLPKTRLYIYGPQMVEYSLNDVLAQNMTPPVFPVMLQDMPAFKEIRGLNDQQMIVCTDSKDVPLVAPAQCRLTQIHKGGLCVRALQCHTHPGGVYAYRVEWGNLAVVYATDTEGYEPFDRRLAVFSRGADLLIHDAQYTEEHYLGLAPGRRSTRGWGHSTTRMACELAQEAGVRRLALFHYDPSYSDVDIEKIEANAQTLFSGSFAAREGEKVEIVAAIEGQRQHFVERSQTAVEVSQ